MNKDVKQKKYPKPLKDLTLLDRFLFDTAMENPEFCQNVLDIILPDQMISKVTLGVSEKTMEPYYDSRAVRLDLLAFDENDVVYDAEAQKDNKGKRATRIFLNTHGGNEDEVSGELVEFLHYMENSANYSEEIRSPRVQKLAKQVDDIKSSQEVGVKYMKMLEELNNAREEGREEGRTVTLIERVRVNLEKGRSVEMIADFMGEKLENIELISELINNNPDKDDDDILELFKEKRNKNGDIK